MNGKKTHQKSIKHQPKINEKCTEIDQTVQISKTVNNAREDPLRRREQKNTLETHTNLARRKERKARDRRLGV